MTIACFSNHSAVYRNEPIWIDSLNRRSCLESDHLDSCHGFARPLGHGLDVRVRLCLRQGVKGAVMIILAAIVTLLLFIYLLAALLRPQWF